MTAVIPLCTGLLLVAVAGCCDTPRASEGNSVDYSKTPVLFVHGSGMSSQTWGPMIKALVAEGYPPQYLLAVDLTPNDGTNLRAAELFIAPAVDRLLARAAVAGIKAGSPPASKKVDIVAHSMGAASSRWYAARMEPERIRTWVSLAGSNHGTNALRAHPSAGNDEMVPAFADSVDVGAFQVSLNGTPGNPLDESPFGLGVDGDDVERVPPDSQRGILYLTVYIEPDQWIKPESSALLKGSGGVSIEIPEEIPARETSSGNYLFMGRTNHDGLPQHSDAIRLVVAFLDARNE